MAMDDKHKSLLLWFSILPLVLAMAGYGFTKSVGITLLMAALTLPISGIGAYKVLSASRNSE